MEGTDINSTKKSMTIMNIEEEEEVKEEEEESSILMDRQHAHVLSLPPLKSSVQLGFITRENPMYRSSN